MGSRSGTRYDVGDAVGSVLGDRGVVLNVAGPAPATPPGPSAPPARRVFVVHGRDRQAVAAVWDFLHDLGLQPWDWESVVAATGKAAPHVLDVVRTGFQKAAAVLVLFTPDDMAELHATLREGGDPPYEAVPTGQPRANVLFEAGLAMAVHPDRTVVVCIGSVRPFSDLHGIDFVLVDGTAAKLNTIATRLEGAGCAVDRSGSRWTDPSRFARLDALTR